MLRPGSVVFLVGRRRSVSRTSGPVVTWMRSVCTVEAAGTSIVRERLSTRSDKLAG